jgi:hypothetical protein
VKKEDFMSTRVLTGGVLAALAGAAMLAISASSASAFTLSSPSLEQPMASSQIDRVWWRHYGGWGWHPHYWGWGGPVIVPVVPYYGYRRCWRGFYRWHCNY